MRNQLLRDSDWAGMAHSLEIRTPFVDYELLRALSAVIPCLRTGGAGKLALATAPSIPLPDVILARAKTGFGVPTGRWISSPTMTTAALKGAASRAWSRQVFASHQHTRSPATAAHNRAIA
jgi:asparagine synthase (glutamine-hydrolysing)